MIWLVKKTCFYYNWTLVIYEMKLPLLKLSFIEIFQHSLYILQLFWNHTLRLVLERPLIFFLNDNINFHIINHISSELCHKFLRLSHILNHFLDIGDRISWEIFIKLLNHQHLMIRCDKLFVKKSLSKNQLIYMYKWLNIVA